MGKVGIRPCAILIEDGKVLCIDTKYEDGEYFLFPGGGLEPGETMAEGAIREMFEETGLIVEVKKLVYVNDWIKDKETDTRVLNMFFLVKKVGGDIVHGEKDNGKIKEIKWVDINELKNLDFRPISLAERLPEDYKNEFSDVPYFN
ncbi:NUDIX domain-containing protein [Nanoarchaeota archaeon]